MEMQIEERPALLILRLIGSFDELATDWFDLVGNRVKRMPTDVLVNLGRVTYVDSKGLGVLFDLHKQVEEMGYHMFFCDLSEEVREVFGLAGLEHIFRIYGAEEQALAAVGLGRHSEPA